MRLLSICIVALIAVSSMADKCVCQEIDLSETSYDKQKGERTAEGLKFAIAEDRQIVRNGQFIEPEGIDKYLGRKFDKMSAIIEGVSQVVSAMSDRITQLELSIKELTETVKSDPGRNPVQEETPQE